MLSGLHEGKGCVPGTARCSPGKAVSKHWQQSRALQILRERIVTGIEHAGAAGEGGQVGG